MKACASAFPKDSFENHLLYLPDEVWASLWHNSCGFIIFFSFKRYIKFTWRCKYEWRAIPLKWRHTSLPALKMSAKNKFSQSWPIACSAKCTRRRRAETSFLKQTLLVWNLVIGLQSPNYYTNLSHIRIEFVTRQKSFLEPFRSFYIGESSFWLSKAFESRHKVTWNPAT